MVHVTPTQMALLVALLLGGSLERSHGSALTTMPLAVETLGQLLLTGR